MIIFLFFLLAPPFWVLYTTLITFSLRGVSQPKTRFSVLRLWGLLSALLSLESLVKIRFYLQFMLNAPVLVYDAFIVLSIALSVYFTVAKFNKTLPALFLCPIAAGMLFFLGSDPFFEATLQLIASYGCMAISLWNIRAYAQDSADGSSVLWITDQSAKCGVGLTFLVLLLLFLRGDNFVSPSLSKLRMRYGALAGNGQQSAPPRAPRDSYFDTGALSLVRADSALYIKYDLVRFTQVNYGVQTVGGYFGAKDVEREKKRVTERAKDLQFHTRPSLKSPLYDGQEDIAYQYLAAPQP